MSQETEKSSAKSGSSIYYEEGEFVKIRQSGEYVPALVRHFLIF